MSTAIENFRKLQPENKSFTSREQKEVEEVLIQNMTKDVPNKETQGETPSQLTKIVKKLKKKSFSFFKNF